MNPSRIELKLDYVAAVADWCLDLGDRYTDRRDPEAGLKCNRIAAQVLHRQSRDLSSPRLESNLRQFARVLSEPPYDAMRTPISPDFTSDYWQIPGKGVWLHVLSTALPFGGHTAMALRWMKNDAGSRIHSAVILSQTGNEVQAFDGRGPHRAV